jgi:hypothetical protein
VDRQEFDRRKTEILDGIPTQFHSFIMQYAWDQGHSSGEFEVLSIMQDLVSGLKGPIQKLVNKIQTNH